MFDALHISCLVDSSVGFESSGEVFGVDVCVVSNVSADIYNLQIANCNSETVIDAITMVGVPISVSVASDVEIEVSPTTDEISQSVGAMSIWPKWIRESYVRSIRNLRCHEAIREMLLHGVAPIECARHIQLLGEMTEIGLDTLRQYCEHYKATIPKHLFMQKMEPQAYPGIRRKVSSEIDTLGILDKLQKIQMERIELGLQRERGMQFVMTGGEKNILAMLEVVSKIQEIQADVFGYHGKGPQVIETTGQQVSQMDWSRTYSSPKVNETMSNPESRARVLRFIETVTGTFGEMDSDKQRRIMEQAMKKDEPHTVVIDAKDVT
jgi:hypothetical protein